MPKGYRSSIEYETWQRIRKRCYNKDNERYHRYGGRGIVVCKAWRESSYQFRADMGKRPAKHSIDRIDNDGHYSCGKCSECLENGWPANCRWVSNTEQARNRSNNRYVIDPYIGDSVLLCVLAERYGVNERLLQKRIDLGWPMTESITTPAMKYGQRRKK